MNIEKPEGFEFRDKLSDKTNDASKWLPLDAMFDTYNEWLKDLSKVGGCLLLWKEWNEDHTEWRIRWRCAGPDGTAQKLLIQALREI